jgi:hypothetical protein
MHVRQVVARQSVELLEIFALGQAVEHQRIRGLVVRLGGIDPRSDERGHARICDQDLPDRFLGFHDFQRHEIIPL